MCQVISPEHGPQSTPQLSQVSPLSQVPFPHFGWHVPQSSLQLLHDSPASHDPLPQTGPQVPQSWLHVPHVSPASQVPLPHSPPDGTEQKPDGRSIVAKYTKGGQLEAAHAAAPEQSYVRTVPGCWLQMMN